MPIPVPNSEESQSEFVSRCIKAIYDEYEQSQAAAICYSNWRKKENMKKQEETFVLQPRKNENRGTYLTRCSKHSKMKGWSKLQALTGNMHGAYLLSCATFPLKQK